MATGDFELTMDELRAVTQFALLSAAAVLPFFEQAHPDDPRPHAAVDAARAFARGGKRGRLQRVPSLDAHRAAREATTEVARLAARCAGDAAAASYLHPIRKATQVGHILRAAASEARIAELRANGDPAVAAATLEEARRRATPQVVDVLNRYPGAPAGRTRVGALMSALDASLRRWDEQAPLEEE